VEQEVGGSIPPNCTNKIKYLNQISKINSSQKWSKGTVWEENQQGREPTARLDQQAAGPRRARDVG
jgi:hypothetical protein